MNKSLLRPLALTFCFFIVCFLQVNSQNFTWMKGTNSGNQLGVYGVIGSAAIGNNPGGRENSIFWKDASGNFWIFGGYGVDFIGNTSYLSDLWKYNPSTNLWVWQKGSNIIDQVGVYGSLGVPSASASPGGRIGSVSWVDQSGNFWLFGGYGLGSLPGYGYLSDLWKFNPGTNQWTWVAGSNVINQPAQYGTQGVSSATNIPGARTGSKCWVDGSNNVWIFGGIGNTTNTLTVGHLDDLWKYNTSINEWVWMKGTNAINQNGLYGTQAAPSPTNNPGARKWPMGWVDLTNGTLWLFGGEGFDALSPNLGQLNDLWKFDINTNDWVWVNGSNSINQIGNYSTFGVPSPANRPGARSNAITWLDAANNYWLFSGFGITTNTITGQLNDLWRYDVSLNQWTWVKGNNALNQNGSYGSQGVGAATNIPGARLGSVNWMDSNNNLWFFGGKGFPSTGAASELNDVWKYQNCFISPITMTISTANQTMCANETTSLTVIGSSSYTWSTNGNLSYIVINPSSTTTYSVFTSGNNNCIYSASFTQSVLPCTGVEKNTPEEKVRIFPNPCSDSFFVSYIGNLSDANLILTDGFGRVVYEKKLSSNQERIETDLNTGIYFLKIKTVEKELIGKIIVQ